MVARTKKTAAKKTSAPRTKAAASKTSKGSAKSGTTTNSEPDDTALAQDIVSAIDSGALDFHIATIYNSVEKRLIAYEKENEKSQATAKKAAAAKSSSEKVSTPPRRSRAAAVTPKEGTVYVVSDEFKKLAGAKVEFQRFNKEDKTKSVVVMKDGKPGAPVGKRLVIPTNALTAAPASASKKTAAKKTTAKK